MKNDIKKIGIITANAIDFQIKLRVKYLEKDGHQVNVFNIDEEHFQKKLYTSLETEHYSIFMTHNFKGFLDMPERIRVSLKASKTPIYSTIDNPFNKFELLKAAPQNCCLYIADGEQIPIYHFFFPKAPIDYTPSHAFTEECSVGTPLKEREIDILFVGRVARHSHLYSNIFYKAIKKRINICHKKNQHTEILRLILANTTAFTRFLISRNGVYSNKFFLFVFDTLNYIRDKNRRAVIEQLKELPSHYNIKVITDQPSLFDGTHITAIKPQDWEYIINDMKKSKIFINIEPLHMKGYSCRFLTALAHGCTVLTNSNISIKEDFSHLKTVKMFNQQSQDLEHMIPEVIKNIDIIQNGVEESITFINNNHMFNNRLEKIYELLRQVQ